MSYLTKIELDLYRALDGKLEGRDLDPGYHLHGWLAGTFGTNIIQPFVVKEGQRGAYALYGYTEQSGSALRERVAQFADPAGAAAIVSLTDKAMPTTWRAGTRVGFELRTVPTVRLANRVEARPESAGPDKPLPKGAEVDAYLAARWRTANGEPAPERYAVYQEWVQRRLEAIGATLTQFEVTRHHLARMLRRNGQRKPKSFNLPEMECRGELVVEDGAAFADGLAKGIGRHKAFGFGMLLLRPPC